MGRAVGVGWLVPVDSVLLSVVRISFFNPALLLSMVCLFWFADVWTFDVEQCQNLGSSMNLVDACPQQDDKSCQVSCQDPSNSGKCVVLDTMLIDGSPCGYGGMCYNGTCQSKGVVASVEVCHPPIFLCYRYES